MDGGISPLVSSTTNLLTYFQVLAGMEVDRVGEEITQGLAVCPFGAVVVRGSGRYYHGWANSSPVRPLSWATM